jgi:hypothetical protein
MEITRDLQRIARIFNLKADDPMLVLKIGDIVKAKEDKYKKQDFCYYMLKVQNKKVEKASRYLT